MQDVIAVFEHLVEAAPGDDATQITSCRTTTSTLAPLAAIFLLVFHIFLPSFPPQTTSPPCITLPSSSFSFSFPNFTFTITIFIQFFILPLIHHYHHRSCNAKLNLLSFPTVRLPFP